MKSKQQLINERNQLLKIDPKSVPHFDTEKALALFDKLIPGVKVTILTEEVGDKETDSYLVEIGTKEYTIPVADVKNESDIRAAVKRLEAGLFL